MKNSLFFLLKALGLTFFLFLTGCYRDDDVIPTPPSRNYDITNVNVTTTVTGDTINFSLYAPVTVNSPVYVNITDKSRVIVYGDNIYNVINVDARTFVDLSGQSTVVEVNFAEGAISFNNEVYLVNENNNNWYSDDDVWIKVEGDTITQHQMVAQVTNNWMWNVGVLWVVDSLPSSGNPASPDTVWVEVGSRLIPLHCFPANLMAGYPGSIAEIFSWAELDSNLTGGQFGLFWPINLSVGQFEAVVYDGDCYGVDTLTRIPSVGFGATSEVLFSPVTPGQDTICHGPLVNQIGEQWQWTSSGGSGTMSVGGGGIPLQNFLNPNPAVWSVSGVFIARDTAYTAVTFGPNGAQVITLP